MDFFVFHHYFIERRFYGAFLLKKYLVILIHYVPLLNISKTSTTMEDSQPTDKDYEIKSVKRLSDGKVFSAGEKYDGYSIMHFEERDGKLLVAITDKEFKSPGLSVLMHLKNL